MNANKILFFSSLVIVAILLIIGPIITFNNKMVVLKNLKQAELDITKTSYSQCIIKITETNSVAKAYKNDILEISSKSGDNLKAFSEQTMTWLNTQIIPTFSPELRITVQKEIIACRNEYSNRIDENLKPLYITYNNKIETFPGNLINMLFGYNREDLNIPKTEEVQKIFDTKIDKAIDLQ